MKKICSILTMLVVIITLTANVVSAATVVPSIDQKQAPSLAVQTDENGNKYVAMLVDKDGNVLEKYDDFYIELIPLVDADSIKRPESRIMIENFYQRIIAAADLSEICQGLVAAVAGYNDNYPNRVPELKVENLVVLDLFDLSASDEIMNIINTTDAKIVVYFDLGVEKDDPLFIVHNYEGDNSELIYTEYISDGVIAATFESFSPVAIVVEGDVQDVPKTGDDQSVIIFVITGIAAVAALALLVLKRVTKK